MNRALVCPRLAYRALACCVFVVAGCASTVPVPPGTVLPNTALTQAITPGVTTRAMLLAGFGPTSALRFDSGYEVWRYLTPATAGNFNHFGEFVIVLDPRGIVANTRSAPVVYQMPPQKR